MRHRIIIDGHIHSQNSSGLKLPTKIFVDTGAFNTMIDIDIVQDFGVLLPMPFEVTIGSYKGIATGCILHEVSMGDFLVKRVFAMAYPFEGWLRGHMLLGLNVMNNWDYTISRSNNIMRFVENVPHDAPNKVSPYQNFFKNGKYVAVQDR